MDEYDSYRIIWIGTLLSILISAFGLLLSVVKKSSVATQGYTITEWFKGILLLDPLSFMLLGVFFLFITPVSYTHLTLPTTERV